MPIALTQRNALQPLMRDAFIRSTTLKGYLAAYIGPDNTNPSGVDGILFEAGGHYYSHPQFTYLFPKEPNYRLYVQITLEGDTLVVQPLHLTTNEKIGVPLSFSL